MEDTSMLDVADEPRDLTASEEMEVDSSNLGPINHHQSTFDTNDGQLSQRQRLAHPAGVIRTPKRTPKIRFHPYPSGRRWLEAKGPFVTPEEDEQFESITAKSSIPDIDHDSIMKPAPAFKLAPVVPVNHRVRLKKRTSTAYSLTPIRPPKHYLDDEDMQWDTNRRDPRDIQRMNIDNSELPGPWPQNLASQGPSTPPQVGADDICDPLKDFIPLMSGALRDDPYDRSAGGFVPISPDGTICPPEYIPGEFEHDNHSGITTWRGRWLPCHRVTRMYRCVKRGVKQTFMSTVQFALEVVGSVKRRAFGIQRIESRKEKPARLALSSRKRLEARRRDMLVGLIYEQRRALRDQWKREDRDLPPSPTSLVTKSRNEQMLMDYFPSPHYEQTPVATQPPSRVYQRPPTPYKASLKKDQLRRKTSPTRKGSPVSILNRTQKSRVAKSKSRTSASKRKPVKGEWIRTSNGFILPWLRHIPQRRVSLDSLDPSFPVLPDVPSIDPPSFATPFIQSSMSHHPVDNEHQNTTESVQRARANTEPAEHIAPPVPRTTKESSTSRGRADTQHTTISTAEADETVLRPDLAPYLQRVDHNRAEKVAVEDEVEPNPAENVAVEDQNVTVEDHVEQVRQQLSAATVANDEPAGHRPLSVTWLTSDTPLGRPISSVRLFDPESPVRPRQRREAVYERAWRKVEKLRPSVLYLPEPGRAVRPLSAKWEARVADAMSAPNSRQLATTLNGDPLTRRDLATCHKPVTWLNDEVINAYLPLLVNYLRRVKGNAGRLDQPKYHAFNSFFFSNLRDRGYESVRRWATRAKIGGEALLEVDTVMVPVHHHDHWTLLVVRPAARSIVHFDSLGSRSLAHINTIKSWLRGELKDRYVEEEWTILPSASPQQDNGSDCGVFLLTTAKAVAVGLEPVVYGPSDITTLRKKIVAELINGGLEGEFDPVGESGELRL
jgi:hypothetical protein